ncbi:unnamed protein product, partial [Ectocarpus sp. 12 AP-2014]
EKYTRVSRGVARGGERTFVRAEYGANSPDISRRVAAATVADTTTRQPRSFFLFLFTEGEGSLRLCLILHGEKRWCMDTCNAASGCRTFGLPAGTSPEGC